MIDFPFEKYSTVVDVGGGIGAFSLPLAKMHKNVKITIHDLPEALVQARNVSRRVIPASHQLTEFRSGRTTALKLSQKTESNSRN